jgi:hypothetical protein
MLYMEFIMFTCGILKYIENVCDHHTFWWNLEHGCTENIALADPAISHSMLYVTILFGISGGHLQPREICLSFKLDLLGVFVPKVENTALV